MNESYIVEVFKRPAVAEFDEAAARIRADAERAGHPLGRVRTAHVYEVGPLTQADAERLAQSLFVDAVLEEARVRPSQGDDDHPGACAPEPGEAVLTVTRRDGVMDPVALSTQVAAKDLGLELTHVRTGQRVYVQSASGPAPGEATLAWLARRLGNPTVDRVLRGAVAFPPPPRAPESQEPLTQPVPLAGLDPEALVAVSRERTLALDAVEMQAVQAHYAALGREPSELELETLAQTWSEHCKHKTLAGAVAYEEQGPDGSVRRTVEFHNLLKQTVFQATAELDLPHCLSVFKDNAGVIRLDDTQGVAIKVETHNHPSAIEPYGGAGTGIGGVIRDILGTGLGARPVLNLDVFCVGDLEAEDVPPGTIHPRTLLEGVVAGVRDYGNRIGIPTACGALVSHPDYVGNPLVYAGTVGVIPIHRIDKAPQPGDKVIAVGGRTGRDGIHGATFSSETMTSESETQSGGAVQIGNPIQEKMFLDVLLEVRDQGWLRAVTDCGAGGFSSAVGEMAAEIGARVDMSLAPLKYAGLRPWEVWISEAQERMVLAVPPEHAEQVVQAFAAEDVEAVVLGEFTGDQRLTVTWGETVIGELECEFLHDGLPRQVRQARWRDPGPGATAVFQQGASPGQLLRRCLAHPTVASKEWIIRQYDHEVQGQSVLKPLVGARARGPGDGVAITAGPDTAQGIVVGLGIDPLARAEQGQGDPYAMAVNVVDEALRNVVAAGGKLETCGILDNFSWGDCRRPEQLGAMVRACEGLYDAAKAYRAPFISGKDSLNNEYVLPDGTRVAIPATILVSAMALVPDVSQLISMDVKQAGNLIYLVGPTRPALAGTLLAEVEGVTGGDWPQPDLQLGPQILAAVQGAIGEGLVRSAHDLSEGGLAVAAAEMAFAGQVGLTLELDRCPRDATAELADLELLFAESPSRFLLEVSPGRAADLETALAGVPFAKLGLAVAEPRLSVLGQDGQKLLDEDLDELEETWREPLFRLYGTPSGA